MRIHLIAGLAGLVLMAALPYLLSQGLLNAAIQMLIAALFASAYNLLCGQAGMLSFGHAAYFGVGAFATVHAMNAVGGAGLLPTPLMPLAGAVGGLIFGGIAGWFATQRSGTYFAMITLAIAELVHSLAPHLKGVFGGEAGLSTMRMPAWGFDFGSTTQVYYLTLAWVLVSLVLLYAYTRTPLGRLTLGLRENSHRLRFLGYNVHGVATLVFALSAMFSGVAGSLQVISNESANYVVFDPALSAAAVLNTYIGGVQVFLGPALGAALMTFFGYFVSDLTRSWLLYQGILFVLVMMFMPTGLSGLAGLAASLRQRYGLARTMPVFGLALGAAAAATAGAVFLVELLQRLFSQEYRAMLQLDPGGAWPSVTLFGQAWQVSSVATWGLPALLFGAAALLAWRCRLRLAACESVDTAPAALAPQVRDSKEAV
ncbi:MULTISPECIES: branched-chain amino acid ABC transporter permease [Achromobacter]|jgi:branched-chain amino acid transport system permease protein|uniref:Branched-chain amino acid ABC transporter permease n=1 Tax=Achromobacter denitrificans TaxID=32002 RepID=A0A427WM11_ACHDE|nr:MULTISPECIES: branched-chain amino acid ABC transporter permease [Achromobacter]MDF3850501.1 branched-chain amino acid ABC transporter permease [Achromobacter denitrificans]MDF3939775.1 branched-chain amino acid ABC transporter permease [Achromobacter denitrificans]OLU06890.1 branched-chain amino acid ABC transporter permease [Achromobacter denitrificans]QKH44606.1 branched-chain amino acid ABC transporter permease [Achromobacter denitrificans]QKH48254.1 branched-chain amino acid ABC transp